MKLRGASPACKLALRPALPHHFSAIGVERVVDNPFGGVDRVIIFVAEMPEAFRDGLQARSFRLMIERVVGIGTIDDLAKQHERGIGRELVFFQDRLE